jgi:DNA-binding response OmpR family regulator
MKVLVVSADAKERLRAVSALELQADAEVVEAESGEEVRQRLLRGDEAFDVLVVDGDLQPRGGYALLYDLRAQADLTGESPTPSILLLEREQDVWLARWAGANDWLYKPVDPFDLARRVVAAEGAQPPPYGDAGSAAKQVSAALREIQ